MKPGNNGRALIALTADLGHRWEITREQWDDVKSAAFHREYLADLLAAVPRSGAAFDELEKVLERVRRYCE